MGEKEDKEKAEKLAAAKKRVAQMQKKKKAAGGTAEKSGTASKGKTKDSAKAKDKDQDKGDDVAEEEPQSPVKEKADENEAVTEDTQDAESSKESKDAPLAKNNEEEGNADEAAFNEAIRSAQAASAENDEAADEVSASTPSPDHESSSAPSSKSRQHPGRQPSISLQSKIRSASFRQSAGASPLSPSLASGAEGGDDVQDIYRKQLQRIEELEKENKRLAKEAQESEGRWRKNEEELEELREKAVEGTGDSEEIERLKSQIESLKRNSRQSVSLSNATAKGRTGSVPNEDADHLKQEIESKDSTISDMQLEISRLRSQVSAQTEGCGAHGQQISALTASLERAEGSVKKLETELGDTKKSLSRATEKAVLDGTERTSKDTKIKSMERELEEVRSTCEEHEKKVEGLEKKIEAMNKLHREAEQRNSTKLAAVEGAAREANMLRAKVESLEADNGRLREAKKRSMSGGGGGGDDGLDELEDEARLKLERRIRELEGENFDLRRGVWRDKRKEMQPDLGGADGENPAADDFDEVDLNGSSVGASRRTSSFQVAPSQARHSGFTQVLNSGLAAFREAPQQQSRPRNDSLLQEFDDDIPFDEHAFAAAQREEEMKKMVERVREIKKGLKEWVGWRLDLVDIRRSGGTGMGYGEVFEV